MSHLPKLVSREQHFRINGEQGLGLFLRYLGPAATPGSSGIVLYVHGATFPSALSIAHRFDGHSWRRVSTCGDWIFTATVDRIDILRCRTHAAGTSPTAGPLNIMTRIGGQIVQCGRGIFAGWITTTLPEPVRSGSFSITDSLAQSLATCFRTGSRPQCLA